MCIRDRVSTQSTWENKNQNPIKNCFFKMVIKTEQCSFSEFKIYPGHGTRFIARDGRGFIYLNRKCAVFSRRKVKAQKITWTVARRRLNKKIKQDEVDKKKRKRQVKIQRAIEGIALEDIQKKRTAKPQTCLLYTSPSPRDRQKSRMPSSA
eukprot:TRINITY_DN489_c0_g1_i1.p2 TRINITY_DN489_c0_g1~~TRINITY_DN489_c0_g1_i1.p2  ORF type:complete len:151 (-),score=33.56 TRINITY_DN489_c0_g1_i1:23-475(-)